MGTRRNNKLVWIRPRGYYGQRPVAARESRVRRRHFVWLAATALTAVIIRFFVLSPGAPLSQEGPGEHVPVVIESPRIYPDPAHTRNRLEVTFNGREPADPSTYSFTWKRNGQTIEGAESGSLGPGLFTKGDEISVEISTVSPGGSGQSFRTTPVRIRNTPPRILSVSTVLATRTVPEIHVRAECLDVDDDPVTYAYLWYRNGTVLENQTDSTLTPSLARSGDYVFAEIIASDGESSSAPVRSRPLEIVNHAPRIVSSPDASVTTDGTFVYQLEAEDPDLDTLVYELLDAPPRMTVDANGRVEWIIPTGARPTRPETVRIRVFDEKGGEAIQKFSVHLASRNLLQ